MELEQLFFSSIEDIETQLQRDEIQNFEESLKLKIVLPSDLIRDINMFCDQEIFCLFMATTDGKIYKFKFKQNWPFTKSRRNFIGVSGYTLDVNPVSFCVLKVGAEDDICIGSSNGSLHFASLPQSNADQYTKPLQITEIGPPSNLIKAFSNMLRQQVKIEFILRVASMRANQVICLSSLGFLRLYNSSKPSLSSEVDLGTGEISNYKFASLSVPSKPYIAVGIKDKDI